MTISHLTPAVSRVVEVAAQRMSDCPIAEMLFVTLKTVVEVHRGHGLGCADQ
ncbi:hypothetical protein OJ998_00760 [Solirubrobacter taibaiensis]|nr:hypothetical protein [Solirubrobacter taibaiensis]